jgi:CRP/FNR family transcriptional regulator
VFEQTLSQAPLRRVEVREFLFTEGDASTHLYRIETGALALHKVLADGRRQIMGFVYPGDLIGLGNQGQHLMNAQAVKPTRIAQRRLGACLGLLDFLSLDRTPG